MILYYPFVVSVQAVARALQELPRQPALRAQSATLLTATAPGMPPDLQLDRLDCRAVIDYLTVAYGEARPAILPPLDGQPKWFRKKGASTSTLTVHDPSARDIKLLVEVLGNPLLTELELSVDFWSKEGVPEGTLDEFLRDTYVALAARFRPEDMTPWGYGLRGGVTGRGQKPLPFHQRLPDPAEQLVYGRRGDFLQSKLYLKRVDQDLLLPSTEHRVRLELKMRRWALIDHFQLDRLSDVLGYSYRKTFTKHFRIVAGPRLRLNRAVDAKEKRKRELRMSRAWATAGVGKFAVAPDLPPETTKPSIKQISSRARSQLSQDQYVLIRHQAANEKIGLAFKTLERRLR